MANLLEDFEEEKNKEEALAKDLEKFKLAVDNVSDNIIISDPEGVVIYANKAVEKVTGYTAEETIGKKSGSLWSAPMPKEYYQKMWDTIKTQKKMFSSEIQNRRKNGELYTASVSISPILDKNGEVIFFVAIERDISREKEVDRLKDEFVSIASHELRTPLTAIDGLVSMIRDGEYGPIDTNIRQPLEDINASSERLIRLVNDLLNLSRLRSGRMKYTLSDFLLPDTITEAVRLLVPIATQKGLQLATANLEPVTVQADPEKVKEILNNLIGNSLKFTDHGSITVSTKTVNDTVEVHIADTGIGIAKEDQQKLFGLFQQLESGIGRPAGTGLGLHISKELVSKMGGDLRLLQSELGRGSTFAFSLPLAGSPLAKNVLTDIEKEASDNPDQKSVTINETKQYG
jgi:PAS domain S-box-containing protein